MYMGFSRESAEQALKVFKGNIHLASQTLAHYGGVLPASLQLSPEGSSPSEESASSKDSPTESAGKTCCLQQAGEREGGRPFFWLLHKTIKRFLLKYW